MPNNSRPSSTVPQDGAQFTPTSLNETKEFSVLSPCSEKDGGRVFQKYAEDDKPFARTHYSPLYVPPTNTNRTKPKPKPSDFQGLSKVLDHSMGVLEVWLELAELVSQFLEERAGLGEEKFLLRFALANLLVLLALCCSVLGAGLIVRAFIGRILGLAFFLLLVRAWVSRENGA